MTRTLLMVIALAFVTAQFFAQTQTATKSIGTAPVRSMLDSYCPYHRHDESQRADRPHQHDDEP